jgi:hypothetical protein
MLYCVAPCCTALHHCAGRACAFKSGNKLTSLMYVESKSARVTGVHTCQRQPPPPSLVGWQRHSHRSANIPTQSETQSYRYRKGAQGRRTAGPSGSHSRRHTPHNPARTHPRSSRARCGPWNCCTQGDYSGSEHLPLGGQQREDRRGLRRRARGDQMAEFAKDVRADLPQAAHPLVSLL